MCAHTQRCAVSIERITLDQNKGYAELNASTSNMRPGGPGGRPTGQMTHVVSMRSRWVGKSGRIRREGMGKRVNFCARSVVTCDSYIDADEIMVPHSIACRLTAPLVVHAYNVEDVERRMREGQVLFIQRTGSNGRMRSITHVAIQTIPPFNPLKRCMIQTYVRDVGDCLIRHNIKYPGMQAPPPLAEDIPLPVQCASDCPVLCFGDRIRRKRDGALLDPMLTITWPALYIGDTVLVTPRDGDWCLMNKVYFKRG